MLSMAKKFDLAYDWFWAIIGWALIACLAIGGIIFLLALVGALVDLLV